MFGEKKLRKIQDNIRNSGWRIQHIPWQPEGKLEMYNPGSPLAWFAIIAGFFCFFGGPFTFSYQRFPVWVGISIMVTGLALLMSSRFIAGRDLYGKFVAVEGKCIDREVQEFEDIDTDGNLIRNTFWASRILCEFEYQGVAYQVTPIIVKMVACSREEEANQFLDERIGDGGRCILWINPDNPLHCVFHKKPKTGPYTA
ncbi:conserved hypothetical protein [Desulfamplus magnetovallimortis]|uniref:Uncharacterized protein n=1 Tax=Desulfamplus magnetovallimortis TaxID=1246637 RepID=A0A1W1H7Y6_9BACT|nr:hypothetical protein [Desulfamplus magnetovallimortis]SLM28495.1 conserved hypothetical protein [Desulfamplus magnetovallimortis]